VSKETLINRVQEIYNTQSVIGSLGVNIVMSPLASFIQTIVRDHSDWESIKSRVIIIAGTVIILPLVSHLINYSSDKLNIERESKLQYMSVGVLGFVFAAVLKGASNYLAMHETSTFIDILKTTGLESSLAVVTAPASIYIKNMTEHLAGYALMVKNIPNWIKKKTVPQKKELLYLGIATSLLMTMGIYALNPSKDHNVQLNQQQNTSDALITYLPKESFAMSKDYLVLD